ncbi:hypothetical protein BH11PLA2_BH11PLA2_31690 [soil metagenome]
MSQRKTRFSNKFLPVLSTLEDRSVPATHTWTGLGATGNWSLAANWDSAGVPGSTAPEPNQDIKIIFPSFGSVTQRSSVQNIPNLIVDQIAFQGSDYSVQLSSGLTLRRGFDNNNTVNVQISASSGGSNKISGGTITSPSGTSAEISVGKNDSLTISSVLASVSGGNGGYSSTGSGVLTLAGANTFSGNFSVAAGTLIAANATAFGSPAKGTTIDEGAILDVRASIGTEALTFTTDVNSPFNPNTLISSTSGSVAGSVKLNFGANTTEYLTVGGAGNLVISGPITGQGGVVKVGTGKTTLSGTNTYNRNTNVLEGTFVVNGDISTSPQVTVESGATLGGSGKIGTLQSFSPGTIAPGLSTATTPMTLTVNGDLVLIAANYTPVVSGTPGGASDKLAVLGAVDITDTVLSIDSTGNPPNLGQVFVIIDNDGTDAVIGTFSGIANGATVTFNGVDFKVSYTGGTGNDVTLTTLTVPNTPPTITDVADRSAKISTTSAAIPFTVGDAETLATALTVTATSSNTSVIDNGVIVIGGTGAQRTITFTTSAIVGSTVITLTVTDNDGVSTSDTFTVTTSKSVPLESEFSVGSEFGGGVVQLLNADGSVRFGLFPFGADYPGGIRTAAGDFNGDGIADVVIASGAPTGPNSLPGTVRVFDGKTQQPIPLPETVAGGGRPFGDTFTRGIIVATGDLNNDGLSDLIITAEAGGGARVRVFQSTGNGFIQRSDFIGLIDGFGIPDSVRFRGGSRAAVVDINGDGTGDLVWAAGAGGGPRIAIFDGKRIGSGNNFANFKLTGDFFAVSDTSIRDGAYIFGGDFNNDGFGDLVAGGGSGAPPEVRIFSGKGLLSNSNNPQPFIDFFFGNTSTRKGVRVAAKDLDGDGISDLVVGSAPTAGSTVTGFAAGSTRSSFSTLTAE